MKKTIYSIIAAAAACGFAGAQTTAYTTPVGYVSQTALNASDTYVSLPLRQPTVSAAALTSDVTSGATDALLTVSTATFGSFANTHYVKFTSGPKNGSIYAITSNTSTTITIDRSGETVNALTGNTFLVSKFWTLAELFNPAASTNLASTTGNAIVSSASATAGNRRTEILLPGTAAGVNLSSAGTFFITGGQWRKQGTAGDFGTQQLWPDNYFIIRHPATVTGPTTYTISGEVDTGSMVVPLATLASGKQDNPIAITRPIDVTLNGLNLGNTPAFVTSATATAGNRRDELLVFNNGVAGLNKSASKTYYFLGGTTNQWRQQGFGVDAGSDIIPAGSAILIRKFAVPGGTTAFWNNTPTY